MADTKKIADDSTVVVIPGTLEIENGHIVFIRPRPPELSELYKGLSIYESAAQLSDAAAKKEIQAHASKIIAAAAEKL